MEESIAESINDEDDSMSIPKIDKSPLIVEQDDQGEDVEFTKKQIDDCKRQLMNVGVKNKCDKVIIQTKIALDVILKFGQSIFKQKYQYVGNCRSIFKDVINSHRFPEHTPEKDLLSNGKAPEQEIIKMEDFIFKINLINFEIIAQSKTDAIEKIFGKKDLKIGDEQYMQYQEIHAVLKPLGIQDFKVPKTEANQIYLDYNILDHRSIRLVNRLIHYLGTNKILFADFMKGIAQEQKVKTKTSEAMIETFTARRFFRQLHIVKIKKTAKEHDNLSQLLCIDKKYQ